MTLLSRNLSLEEMTRSEKARKLKIDNTPGPAELARLKVWAAVIFQPMRDHFGQPLYVSSGFRCDALDTAINRRDTNSQHEMGEAGDLDNDELNAKGISTVTNAEIFHYARAALPFDQLIWEYGDERGPAWVHVSYTDRRPSRGQILRCITGPKGGPLYLPWAP
jgi:zinc D-Ala-D-Ala carboxypeptidase